MPPAPPRKIAILGSRGYPSTYGGFETMVREIAPIWADQGLAVTAYCRERVGKARTWQEGGVICRWTPGFDNKSASTLTYGLSSHLDASIRGFDAALVLNVANGFFLPLLKARGIGTALNTDGIEWERGKWGRTAKRVFLASAHASARHADVLVADSQEINKIWQRQFGVSSEFIPYGAPVLDGTGDDLVRQQGLRPGGYVLVVARLTPENNVGLTLDALDQGSPVPAVVVGDANYDSPIESRLRALDSRSPVRWLGHVSDQELLNSLWANAGVYVHGHSVGGTNPALLQALGAGAPTLALDTPFNREVVGFEDQLYPADAARLGTMIRRVLIDEDLRRAWATRGRETVRARYDWADVAARYLDALELAAARRGSR